MTGSLFRNTSQQQQKKRYWKLKDVINITYLDTVVASGCLGVLRTKYTCLQKLVACYAQKTAHALAFC